MSNEDRQALIELLDAAREILRKDAEASAQSGGTGNGPPGDGGG